MKSPSFLSYFGNLREYPLATASVFLFSLLGLACLITGLTLPGLQLAAERILWSAYFILFSFVCLFMFLAIWYWKYKQECRWQETAHTDTPACFPGLLLDFIRLEKNNEKVTADLKEKTGALAGCCGEEPETTLYEQLASVLCNSYAEVKKLKEINVLSYQLEIISNTYSVLHYRIHDNYQQVLANKSLLIESRPCGKNRFLFSCPGQGIAGCNASKLTEHIKACIRISIGEDKEKAAAV